MQTSPGACQRWLESRTRAVNGKGDGLILKFLAVGSESCDETSLIAYIKVLGSQIWTSLWWKVASAISMCTRWTIFGRSFSSCIRTTTSFICVSSYSTIPPLRVETSRQTLRPRVTHPPNPGAFYSARSTLGKVSPHTLNSPPWWNIKTLLKCMSHRASCRIFPYT